MKRFLSLVLLGIAATASAVDQTSNNVVLRVSSAPQILIPAAGAIEGANGTFFRSEVNILNYGSTDANLEMRWIPRPGEGTSAVTIATLPAGRGLGASDFVTNVLGRSGLGSVIITALGPGGTVDTNARLYVSARIWTNQPGTGGTTSQSFNTLPLNSISSERLAIIGLRRDAQFRLNVGIVNLDATREQQFNITVGGASAPSEATPLTVPALTMQQVGVAGAAQTGLQIIVENVTPLATRSNQWIAYGSSVDNVTGDSWSMLGFTPSSSVP